MITSSIKHLKHYKHLADKSISQVSAEDIFHRLHNDDNSIAMIIQHMSGNMKSRWTNIFTEDGEKEWRNRDAEFEEIIKTRDEVLNEWESGWKILFETLESLTDSDLIRSIYIRNEGITVADAIIRQLCHYSYHIGQIVYKCKQCSNGEWKTLSIAQNHSVRYNFKKFEQIKAEKDYLDSLMDDSQ